MSGLILPGQDPSLPDLVGEASRKIALPLPEAFALLQTKYEERGVALARLTAVARELRRENEALRLRLARFEDVPTLPQLSRKARRRLERRVKR